MARLRKALGSQAATAILLMFFSVIVLAQSAAQWGYHEGYLVKSGQNLYERPVEDYKILLKWSVNYTGKTPVAVSSGDIDFDRREDVVLALSDNSILSLDKDGSTTGTLVEGESNPRETIYDLALRDVDGDSRLEIIAALGGGRQRIEYQSQDFEVDEEDGDLVQKEIVLLEVTRSLGGLAVYGSDGGERWSVGALDGYRDVDVFEWPSKDSENIYVAAQGESTFLVYNKKIDYEEGMKLWEDMDENQYIENWNDLGVTATASECQSFCESQDDDYCGFNESTSEYEPSHCCCEYTRHSTQSDCQYSFCDNPRDYCGFEDGDPPRCCCRWTGDDIVQWNHTSEHRRNGSLVFYDLPGNLLSVYSLMPSNEKEYDVNEDYNPWVVKAGHLNNDLSPLVLVGQSNGNLHLLDVTNLTDIVVRWSMNFSSGLRALESGESGDRIQEHIFVGDRDGYLYKLDFTGKLIWKAFLSNVIVDIKLADLEDDGETDVIALTGSGGVFLYTGDGGLKWFIDLGMPVTGLHLSDVDSNGLTDILITSPTGLYCFEVSDYYVKKTQADTAFNLASDYLEDSRVSEASIYIEKALLLYEEIGARNELSMANRTRYLILHEFTEVKAKEADDEFDTALKMFSMNKYNESIKHALIAQSIYVELGDEVSAEKTFDLIETIEGEARRVVLVKAESLFSEANLYKSFRNFTVALDKVYEAKELYDSVDYFNGSLQCNLFIKEIAELKITTSRNLHASRRYTLAYEEALSAWNLYDFVGDIPGKSKASTLLAEINQSLSSRDNPQASFPWTYLIGLIVVVGVILVGYQLLLTKTKPQIDYPTPENPESQEKWVEDELDDF
jgi:tetratricopeptide (TPR) repeat protein